MSYEAELVGLAVLFYLYDSSLLLFSNEGVLTVDSAQRWSAHGGWVGFVLAGRRLCMLNPFTPHRPSFRLRWDFDSLDDETQDRSWTDRAQRLRRLAPMTLTAAVALFILLPAGLFSGGSAALVIPAVALLYGSIGFALFHVHRGNFLPPEERTRFAGFAFECIACPPFGINMIRRLTLKDRIAEPLPLAAVRLLAADRWEDLRAQCIARLDEAANGVAEASDAARSLEAQKQRLCALAARP